MLGEQYMDSTVAGAAGSVSAESGSGGQPAATGATVQSVYHGRTQDIVGINVEDLREFKSDRMEEFWQFVIAEFFVAGGFWLGMERFVTVQDWKKDTLFWICVIAVLAGTIVGFFGYKQLSRRHSRIERIIISATKKIPDTAST